MADINQQIEQVKLKIASSNVFSSAQPIQAAESQLKQKPNNSSSSGVASILHHLERKKSKIEI